MLAHNRLAEFGPQPQRPHSRSDITTVTQTRLQRPTRPSIAKMSDNGEVEVENPSGYQVLPKEVTDEIGSIKLFNKWSYEDVEIRDISLTYV